MRCSFRMQAAELTPDVALDRPANLADQGKPSSVQTVPRNELWSSSAWPEHPIASNAVFSTTNKSWKLARRLRISSCLGFEVNSQPNRAGASFPNQFIPPSNGRPTCSRGLSRKVGRTRSLLSDREQLWWNSFSYPSHQGRSGQTTSVSFGDGVADVREHQWCSRYGRTQ